MTDAPAILFSEELITAYPDAKVILTNRDPAQWWKSYSGSLQAIYRSKRVQFAEWLDPRHFGKVIPFTQMSVSLIMGSAEDAKEEESTARYLAHYENVRKMVPKEQLLEYEVGEGWDRLCSFLGKDIPHSDFPRINDTKAFRHNIGTWVGQIYRRTATRLAVPAIILISLCLGMYAQRYGV